ncbi:unnamed protein product [Rotaria socialis]|uniref:FAD-binding domain-containing protein n=1 Tax=Rotaria socialis TaxID=392032 RepID=A0A820VE82_9BILA|nr:unnamed protein product [Rotaria socialis]CAF4498781.1 unnamed protein product [Rotaria socialis]CAF4536337.1 unnamed protein product [Rotaria socialis]CAF4801451.1 unnamed protein product [Rotaria socialis]
MPFNYPNQPPIDFLNAQPLYGRPVTMHSFPDKVDVLIVGAGPAGLMAAHALSSFGISVRVIDQRPNSVIAGQADGIQPRTIEVLQSYGLASRLIKEGNQMWCVFIRSLNTSKILPIHEYNQIWIPKLPLIKSWRWLHEFRSGLSARPEI